MKHLTWICAAVGLLFAGGDGSLSPRPSAADYPAHAAAPAATIAAEAVAPEHARKMLGADLYRAGYVVLEVAVYPQPASDVNLSLGDFTLRTESARSTVRPAASDVVAAAIYPGGSGSPPGMPHKVDVYTETTIGYGSGGYGRPGGVYGGGGVGVGNGGGPAGAPPAPAPTKERDRNLLEVALSEKALPAGKTAHAVAGYLYFPKPASRGKNTAYELTWSGGEAPVRMSVPLPAK